MTPDDVTIRRPDVVCPECLVEYADEPFRCEACGYRFKGTDAD